MSKYNYIRNHLDLEYYHNQYSESRTKLHESIVDKYFVDKAHLKNPDKHNKFIFTSGAYGCGKSHILKMLHKHNKIDLDKFIFVDPDMIRSELPEYLDLIKSNPWTAGFATNQETFYIGELIRYHAMFEGINVIYDSSLRDWEWTSLHIKWLRENFSQAKIIIIHVYADWVKVLERNISRSEQTKRCIPLENIKQAYVQSIESNTKLKDLVDLNIIIKNNSDEELEKIILENDFQI